jgi:hypothetical protein
MSGFVLDHTLFFGLFLGATFAAALVAGLAGFAFGIVAAAAWLHVLTPLQTVTLIIGYGLIVQGYAVWKLRHALSWSRLWPFLLGGMPGVGLGIFILGWTNPAHVRMAMGVVLVLYSVYGLARPTLKPVQAGTLADLGVGFLNGVLGGMTGLAGIIVVIWSGVRGWPNIRDERRRARDRRCDHHRYRGTVPARSAGTTSRHLGRLEALRLSRRSGFPQGCAGAAAGVRRCADFLMERPGGNTASLSTSLSPYRLLNWRSASWSVVAS